MNWEQATQQYNNYIVFNKQNIDLLKYKFPKIVNTYHQLFDNVQFDTGLNPVFLSTLYLYGVNGENIVCRYLKQQFDKLSGKQANNELEI